MKNIVKTIRPILALLATIWLVEIINILTDRQLNQYGIIPRITDGLIGIPLSPFLHANVGHALSNSLPLAMLGGLLISTDRKRFLIITLIIIFLGGLGVWLFARSAYHIGASGLVFGYFGALLARGIFERNFASIVISIAVAVLYGGLIWGILPIHTGVSFEAHLFGFLAGVVAAWIMRRR